MRRLLFISVLVAALLAAARASAAPIFAQTPTPTNGQVSDLDAFGHALFVADDFRLGADDTIRSVRWLGFYFLFERPEVDAFTVNFYSDDGGTIGSLLQSFAVGDAVRRTRTDFELYGIFAFFSYAADLPGGFAAAGGTPYWLSIFNDTSSSNAYVNWYWAQRENAGNSRYLVDGQEFGNSLRPATYFVLDNTTLPVPEPASMLLVGVGLAASRIPRIRRWLSGPTQESRLAARR